MKRTVFASVFSILLAVLLSFAVFADTVEDVRYNVFRTQDLLSKLGTSDVISPTCGYALYGNYGTITPSMGFFTLPWLRNYDYSIVADKISGDWFNFFGDAEFDISAQYTHMTSMSANFPAYGYGDTAYFFIAVRHDGTYFESASGNVTCSTLSFCDIIPDEGSPISCVCEATYEIGNAYTGDGDYTVYRFRCDNTVVIKGISITLHAGDSFEGTRQFTGCSFDIMMSDVVFETVYSISYPSSIDTAPFQDNHSAESDIASLYNPNAINSVINGGATAVGTVTLAFAFWRQIYGFLFDIPLLYGIISVAAVLTLFAFFLHLGIPFIESASFQEHARANERARANDRARRENRWRTTEVMTTTNANGKKTRWVRNRYRYD